MTTTPEEKDYIAQVIAEDDAARKPRPQRFKDLPEAVPPAGGEVEVLAIFKADGSSLHHTRAGFNRPLTGADIELVDRAHVTRLQAERDALKAEVERLTDLYKDADEHMHHWQRQAESVGLVNKATQYELTKARELLASICSRLPVLPRENWWVHTSIDEQLAHQSAPAAKDGNDE